MVSVTREHEKRAARGGFDLGSLGLRFAAALFLVLATYNPTQYSYTRWVLDAPDRGPVHAFVGVLLLIGWVVFLSATLRALGLLGLLLTFAFFGTLVWMLTDFGIVAAESARAITWIALVCLAGVLSIGVSWSHIWRRLTGQVDVDDVED